jgi:hypothetical protein
MLLNEDKIILDLCGGTGAWSAPYRNAGYDTRIITTPEQDVRCFKLPKEPIWGILAAPPCTHFAGSGAQYWKQKDEDGRTLEALSIVDACIRIIYATNPTWWVLENPVGRLRYWLGPPVFSFSPCDFGDPYTKKTLLWGNFSIPTKNEVEPIKVCKQGSWLQKLGGASERTKTLRSITPPGFAKAFFEANP